MKAHKIDLDFERCPKGWCPDNPFKAYYFNAFSLIIPAGEAFFMKSLTYYSRQLKDKSIAKEVAVFNEQESNHIKIHDRLNAHIAEQYGFTKEYYETYERVLNFWIFRGHRHELLCTLSLEYLTYVLSQSILRDKLFEKSDPTLRTFWTWHAFEEIDHKSMTYKIVDQLQIGYFERAFAMLWIVPPLVYMLGLGIIRQAKEDKIGFLQGLKQAFSFFLVKEKMLTRITWGCLSFFKPNHRPDDLDDSAYMPTEDELAEIIDKPPTTSNPSLSYADVS